jgi:hypothetical protein
MALCKQPVECISPDFLKGSRQADINSVDIYQLMCKMLGITPAPNNGTWSHVTGITRFKDEKSGSSPCCGHFVIDMMAVVLLLMINPWM